MSEPEVRFPYEGTELLWRSESDDAAPDRLSRVDDRLTAEQALQRVKKGEQLLYTGDFRNARQLLTAMARRLDRGRRPQGLMLAEEFRNERTARLREHETLSRILVKLDAGYKLLDLKKAPDVTAACNLAWGPATLPTVVPLKALIGMMGAAEWYRKGLRVRGLSAPLHPHYGVFLPTRNEYVDLLLEAPAPTGKSVFDIGTGTGVLSFLLLERGASSAVGTDVDPRAIACAQENAQRLNLGARFTAQQRALFPEGKAQVVISNPPWIPEPPKNRIDRAVFDENNAFLEGFLGGLAAHLTPDGEGWLLMSDLAELLGLRTAEYLPQQFKRAGLHLKWKRAASARHPKTDDSTDPLHQARSREVTTLYCLLPSLAG